MDNNTCIPSVDIITECLLGSCVDPVQTAHDVPEWTDLREELSFGFSSVLISLVLSITLQNPYKRNCTTFSRNLKASLGESGKSSTAWIRIGLLRLQFTVSTLVVTMWIARTYDSEIHRYCKAESAIGIVLFLLYLVEFLLADLTFRFASEWVNMLDIFTAVPIILQAWDCDSSGVSINYMRVFAVYAAISRMRSNSTQSMSALSNSIFRLVLQFITMMIFFAGTMFNLELLGDLQFLKDYAHDRVRYAKMDGSEISLFQMAYFTLVTISTVGYGDISPKSVLGRLFAFVIIAGGVTFFSLQVNEFSNLWIREKKGLGSYNKRRLHIVVVGGAVNNCNVEVLTGFIKQMCNAEYSSRDIPEVILFGTKSFDAETLPIIGDPVMGKYVKCFVGSVFSQKDQSRVKLSEASKCYILADPWTHDDMREDDLNMLTTAHVIRHCPLLPYSLMMLLPQNVNYAVQMGLNEKYIHVVRDCLLMLTASSCFWPGLSTLLINLISGTTIHEYNLYEKLQTSENDHPKWIEEYWNGCTQSVFQVRLGSQHNTTSFGMLQLDLFSQLRIVLIGVRHQESLLLNPNGRKMHTGDCVFVVGSKESVRIFSSAQLDVRDTYNTITPESTPKAQERPWKVCRGSGTRMSDEDIMADLEDDVENEEEDELNNLEALAQPQAHKHGHNNSIANVLPGTEYKTDKAMSFFSTVDKLLGKMSGAYRDHILLIVTNLSDESSIEWTWTKLLMLIFNIRKDSNNKWKTVVILSSEPPLEHLRSKLSGVQYHHGNLRSHKVLRAVCLHRASTVVMVAGKSPPDEIEQALHDNCQIIIRGIIDMYCDLTCIESHRPRIIMEMFHEQSTNEMYDAFLERKRTADATNQSGKNDSGNQSDNRMQARVREQVQRMTFSDVSVEDVDVIKSLAHKAAGEIIPRTVLSGFLAFNFYNPGALEMLSSLFPSYGKGPKSMKRVHKNAIFASFRLPLAMLKMNYGELFTKLNKEGVCLLGLFRPPNTLGNHLSFVCTNPPGNTSLVFGDKAYILASSEWIELYEAWMYPKHNMAACIIQTCFRKRVAARSQSHNSDLGAASSSTPPSV